MLHDRHLRAEEAELGAQSLSIIRRLEEALPGREIGDDGGGDQVGQHPGLGGHLRVVGLIAEQLAVGAESLVHRHRERGRRVSGRLLEDLDLGLGVGLAVDQTPDAEPFRADRHDVRAPVRMHRQLTQ